MRYVVSEGAIGSEGRTVRCANCGHQWFEDGESGLDEALFGDDNDLAFAMPDMGFGGDEDALDAGDPAGDSPGGPRSEEDIAEALEAIAEEVAREGGVERARAGADADDFSSILQKQIEGTPIPEGVRPVPDGEDPVLAKLRAGKKGGLLEKLPFTVSDRGAGYLLAVAAWLAVLALVFFFQPQISRAWPPSNLLYSLAGFKPVPPGEGLAFEGISAEMQENSIRMRGTIANRTKDDRRVPAILAQILDGAGNILDEVYIAPPIARIKGDGRTSFDVTYPKRPEEAKDVSFAFSFVKIEPSAQTDDAEKQGGSAPAAKEHGAGK